MEKICRTCKKEQDICNFKKNPMYKDGYETQCKECQKEIKRKKLIENDDFDQTDVEKKTEELMNAMQEVGKKMYEKAAKEAPKEEPKADDSSKKKDEEKAQEGEVVE